MKVTKEDYQDLVNTIRPFDTADLRETYRTLHAEGKLRANDPDVDFLPEYDTL